MDRKGQLGNVAFGGAWSEQIPRREMLAASVELINGAPGRTEEEDLREDAELAAAVDCVSLNHPKGYELKRSWEQVLRLENAGLRHQELERLARSLTAWIRS
ncbi:hypothetical protein [Pseudosulfitobacter pseudonitzschiae]|uniref:hypothetical protein n=1 Tax=Pseudosulfitobacter pseudonitzschiae TaxID=1402135 RepID=UPI003B7AA38D